MSKKTVGGDIKNEAMEKDVYSIASQILNKLPAGKREAAVESTVQFLAERPEVRGNKNEVRAMLGETMSKQSQNPWFEPIALHLSPAEVAAASHAATPADLPPRPQLAAGDITHVAQGIAAPHIATATGR